MIARFLADRRHQVGENSDSGQIVPLIIAYTLIALTLVIVIVDITAVHLQRDRLYAVADGAALDAADALDETRFYRTGALGTGPISTGPVSTGPISTGPISTGPISTGPISTGTPSSTLPPGAAAVPLTDDSVRDEAGSYLRTAGPGSRLAAITLAPDTGSPDGVTAQVALTARARLPLFSFVVARWSGGVPLRATSRARAITRP